MRDSFQRVSFPFEDLLFLIEKIQSGEILVHPENGDGIRNTAERAVQRCVRLLLHFMDTQLKYLDLIFCP